jgi:osmotically-inducible protein OsmY
VPDWVLGERTRLETWRTLAHPDSIQISVRDGRVTLWGPVLAGEAERLRRKLVKIPGLRTLDLQLTTREEVSARVA